MNRFSTSARLALLGSVAMLAAGGADAQSLAGPKPLAVQTGADAGCIGELSVNGTPGDPRVADGTRTPPTWSIQTVYPTPAVCSFPSARPVDVQCRRNGVAVDPIYCQESSFQGLMAQGYRTVGNSTNWSAAQWVLPGQTDSGCIGQWQTQDGAVPQGCGQVSVDVVSSCSVTNVQSGTPDDPMKYCDPTQRPSATKTVTDFRACGYSIQSGSWGSYSATCGTASHDRSLTCQRQDGTAMDMSMSQCQNALVSYCASHRCVTSAGSIVERETVTLGSCSTGDGGLYQWNTGGWNGGGVTCGSDTQTRSVTCLNTDTGGTVDDSYCSSVSERPASSRSVVVDTGCRNTSSCTGQSSITQWQDAGQHQDHAAQCATAGGDCVEKTFAHVVKTDGQQSDTYLSSCYSGGGNTPVAGVGPGDGPFDVHGITLTSGFDGYCDYSANGNQEARNCLYGAYPVKGCSSGVPNVTLSMPGRVRSGQGTVSVSTAFANADGSNGIEGQECRATSTISNNGETKTIEAMGTFSSSSCLATSADVVGGTSYTVSVDVQVTPSGNGYTLYGTASANGVGCGATTNPTPTPTPTQVPASVQQCNANTYCLLTSGGTFSNCYGGPNYVVDEYVPGGYIGVPFPLTVSGHAIGDPDMPVSGLVAVSKTRVQCNATPTPTVTPTPTPTTGQDGGACIMSGSLATEAQSSYQECIGGMYSASEAPLAFTLRNVDGTYTFCQGNQAIEMQMCSTGTLAWTGQNVCKGSYASCSAATPTPTVTPTPTAGSCQDPNSLNAEKAAWYYCTGNVRMMTPAESNEIYSLGYNASAFFAQHRDVTCIAEADYQPTGNTQSDSTQTFFFVSDGGAAPVPAEYQTSSTKNLEFNPYPRQDFYGGALQHIDYSTIGACNGAPVGPPPTPAPAATPTPAAATQITAGYCRYTSSGGGRHACGAWGADYKVNKASVPGPAQLCSGKLIAGSENFDGVVGNDPEGLMFQTPRAGYHWATPPRVRDVPGTQCIVHWKQGYSGEWSGDQPGWVSAYYDGPPTGVPGQTYIVK